MREKIIRWRKFTRTTLLDPKTQAALTETDQDDFKLKLKLWAKEQGIETKDDREAENAEDDIDFDDMDDADQQLKLTSKKAPSTKKVGFPEVEA